MKCQLLIWDNRAARYQIPDSKIVPFFEISSEHLKAPKPYLGVQALLTPG